MARDEQSRRKLPLRTLNHPTVGGRGSLPLYTLGEVPRQRSGGGELLAPASEPKPCWPLCVAAQP